MDNKNFFNLLENNWFIFFKENKNIILGDIKTIVLKLKNLKITELFLIFLILPLMFFFISIYIIIVIFYIIIFITIFLQKYYYKYILKIKYVKPIKCEIEKSIFSNYILVFIKMIFKSTPKHFAFLYVYNFLKIIKEPKKINKKNATIIILRVLIKIIFIIIFSYSVFVVKNSIEIYTIIKKCLNQNYNDYKTLNQIILFDISSKYYSYSFLLITKKKIKFLKKKIKLNMKPTSNTFKKITEYAHYKISINKEQAENLKKTFDTLINQFGDLRYTQLESTVENETIAEKKPHTSMVLNIDDKTDLLIRATTSKKVYISNDKPMETHTPSQGIINNKKIENKTNIIESKKTDNKIIFNQKLLNNLNKNPNYSNYYNQALINSLENPTYIWDKGDLKRDPKYKNLIDKIDKDPILKNNLEIKKCLDNIVDIYNNNIKNFKNTTNNKVFDAVIKIILSKDNNIDQTTLNLILQLMEKE